MAIILKSSESEVVLPPYLLWEDEFAWSAVEEKATYFLAGSLDIQSGVKLTGRPITLSGSRNRGWIRRKELLAIQELSHTPQNLELEYHGRKFTVRFRYDGGNAPISAQPLLVRIPPKESERYTNLEIRLIEVG